MSDVWFTSDVHFGHVKVAGLRGFVSTAEHDRALARRWAERVKPGDQVWVLGDLAASSPAYALSVLKALPGEKHLIAGNHDRCHPMFRDAHKRQAEYLAVFASVASAGRRRIRGVEALLSHFPYTRDRGDTRHPQWRLRDEGAWLLHGHTHGTERRTVLHHPDYPDPPYAPRVTREIHVGVDAWGLRPVHLDEIAELMGAA